MNIQNQCNSVSPPLPDLPELIPTTDSENNEHMSQWLYN